VEVILVDQCDKAKRHTDVHSKVIWDYETDKAQHMADLVKVRGTTATTLLGMPSIVYLYSTVSSCATHTP